MKTIDRRNTAPNPEQLRHQILAADLAWIPLALAAEQGLCSVLHCQQLPLSASSFVVYLVCTVFAWVLLSENMHLDGFRGGWRLPSLISHLLLAVALLMVLLLAVENVSEHSGARLRLSLFALLLLCGFLAIRRDALRRILRRRQSGRLRRVVILGGDSLALEIAEKFHRHPELLRQVVGFLCPEADSPAAPAGREVASSSIAPSPIDPSPAAVPTVDVIALLHQRRVDELVMAHTAASSEILNLVALCRQQSIRVSLVPQPYELYLSRPSLLDLGGLPLLELGDMPSGGAAGVGKRALDLWLGLVFGAVSLPLLLTAAAVLRARTGKAFRWEKRIGWRGAEFSMLRLNVDHNWQTGSRFERMLGHLSISELPQFWNVVGGEMSLVGPRPESPERAHCYSAWQRQRLAIKPGMTGLAQVVGLREQHSSEDKTRHDLQYMLHPSLLRDLSLLIETIWTLAFRLLRLYPRAASGQGEEPAAVSYSPNRQPFPEL